MCGDSSAGGDQIPQCPCQWSSPGLGILQTTPPHIFYLTQILLARPNHITLAYPTHTSNTVFSQPRKLSVPHLCVYITYVLILLDKILQRGVFPGPGLFSLCVCCLVMFSTTSVNICSQPLVLHAFSHTLEAAFVRDNKMFYPSLSLPI